jgi:hypothetical protein
MNLTKSLIEAKLYTNPTKSLIEPKLYMNIKFLVGFVLYVKFRFYQVLSRDHVKFRFYQGFRGVHVKFRFYKAFSRVRIEPKLHIRRTSLKT